MAGNWAIRGTRATNRSRSSGVTTMAMYTCFQGSDAHSAQRATNAVSSDPSGYSGSYPHSRFGVVSSGCSGSSSRES